MKVKSYRDLDVWKKGVDIVDYIYELTENFPQDEKFGLVAHMRKTAISIPSNLAEGFLRHHTKEYMQFIYVSRGSCGELETQAIISKRRGYASDGEMEKLEEMLDHESRMLMNLIKSLSN